MIYKITDTIEEEDFSFSDTFEGFYFDIILKTNDRQLYNELYYDKEGRDNLIFKMVYDLVDSKRPSLDEVMSDDYVLPESFNVTFNSGSMLSFFADDLYVLEGSVLLDDARMTYRIERQLTNVDKNKIDSYKE